MTAVRSYRSAVDTGRRAGWTAGRIASALAGALLAVCSLGLLGAGGVAIVGQRDRMGIALGDRGLGVAAQPAWSVRLRDVEHEDDLVRPVPPPARQAPLEDLGILSPHRHDK